MLNMQWDYNQGVETGDIIDLMSLKQRVLSVPKCGIASKCQFTGVFWSRSF